MEHDSKVRHPSRPRALGNGASQSFESTKFVGTSARRKRASYADELCGSLELAAGAPPRKPPRGDRERARGGGTGGSLRSGTGGSSAGAAWGGGTLGTGGRALDGMLMAEAGRRAERRGTNTIPTATEGRKSEGAPPRARVPELRNGETGRRRRRGDGEKDGG